MKSRLITTTMVLAILLVPAVVMGQAKNAAQDTEIRLLEEKLVHEREASSLKIKALEDKLADQEKLVEQIDDKSQRRINDSKDYYNKLLIFYTSGFAALLAVLGFLGFKTISNWIQIRIKERIDEILTEDAVRSIISEKGEPEFRKIIDEIKEKAADELEKIKQSRLENEKLGEELKRKIDSNEIGTSRPVKTDDKRDLDAYKAVVEAKPKNERTYHDWFAKGLDEIDNGKNSDAAESFIEASRVNPTAASLGNAALSFERDNKYDKAEEYYRRAVEADPKHAHILGGYANFLKNIRKDYDKAEEYYRRAVEADPTNANHLGNYALFLEEIRKDHDKAEECYRRAVEADPKHADHLGNYALFLKNIRKDYDKAEEYYRRAVKADPKNAVHLGNYALFLHYIRNDYDEAEEYYKRTVEADPKDADHLGSYASFLTDIRRDHGKAEEYYRRAVEADPKNTNALGSYANFLKNIRKDHDKAEDYYRRAVDAYPKHANNLGNYAGFLLGLGRFYDGFENLAKAIDLSKEQNLKELLLECWFYKYAHVKDDAERKSALIEAKKLIKSDVRSPGWDLSLNVERAITDGHPEPELLKTLAKVIADEEKAEVLEQFPAWREA